MVFVHDTFSHCALDLYEGSNKIALTVINLQSGQIIAFSKVTRGII